MLIMMRPTGMREGSYQPMLTPMQGSAGENWDPKKYKRQKDVPTGAQAHPTLIVMQPARIIVVNALEKLALYVFLHYWG